MPTFRQSLIDLLSKGMKPATTTGQSGDLGNPFAILLGTNDKLTPADAMKLYKGWSYAAIRAIAEEIANIQWKLSKQNKDGSKTPVLIHELLDLLNAPNSYQTGYDLKYIMACHMELCGNAFLYLGEIKENEKPTQLQLLNPANVKIYKGEFPDFITKYGYLTGIKEHVIETWQLIHPKYPDPNDPYMGIGTAQAIYDWIVAEQYQTKFNLKYFKNGARIGGFIESENAQTPEQLEYLKRSFEKAASGIENSHKTLALPKGTTYKSGSESPKDMDFNNGQIVERDKILGGYRVPKTALGITDDVNRANAEATNYVFALRTILPKIQLLADYLNEFLVPRFGEDLILEFENPVPQDRELKMKELQFGMAGQPIMSVNEAREDYFGKEAIDGGDQVMTNFNLVPLGTTKPKGEAAKSNGVAIKRTRYAANMAKRKELTDGIVEKTMAAFKQAKEMAKKDITKLSDSEFEPLQKAFAIRVDKYQKLDAENIRKFNEQLRPKVIANLGKIVKSAKKAIDPDELYNSEDEVGILIDLRKANTYDLYEKEGIEAASLIGFENIEMLTPAARKALDYALSLLSESYNETTKQLLSTKLAAGIESGASLDQLINSVNEIFDYSNEVRATQVAHTEMFRVANQSTKDAWKNTGVVKTIKWYTSGDERVCEFCGPLHGKVISIEDDFFTQGDEITGSDGGKLSLDYSDVGAPPLHVNCNCYQRPEEIEGEKSHKHDEEEVDIDKILKEIE